MRDGSGRECFRVIRTPPPTEEEKAKYEGRGKNDNMLPIMKISRKVVYARHVSSIALFVHIPELS